MFPGFYHGRRIPCTHKPSSRATLGLNSFRVHSSGIYTKSPLERYFRDVQVLRHHVCGAETRYETVGQVYLGLPPDFPVLAF